MTLQQTILNRLKAGALLAVVQEPDEQLAVEACRMAGKAIAPKQTRVISVLDDDFGDVLSGHKDTTGVLIVSDLLRVQKDNPATARLLREFALQVKNPPYPRILLVESPGVEIPEMLQGDIEYINTKLPSVEELIQELEQFLRDQKLDLPGNGEMKYAVGSALAGLARHEAARLLARCYVDNKELDPTWIRKAKAERVAERLGGALTFINVEDSPDVGGAEQFQAWLEDRRKAFGSAKAKEFGLPESKGVLALGVPGCGKSALAKLIGKKWGAPLLRLDVGKLFGSLVGQSESQVRQAIEAAEACSPCVLWLDEIEKALGGNKNAASGDSGTTQRVFGTILTWLQEKKKPVFVFATANSVASLPPELLRKGRFDEIFFVDLPDSQEREEIARIHIERRKREKMLDPKEVAKMCAKFSGAEIEQAIIDAMFIAFSQDREVSMDDVKKSAEATAPLSEVMAEDIKALRDWAKSRARLAHESKEKKDDAGGVRRAKIDTSAFKS